MTGLPEPFRQAASLVAGLSIGLAFAVAALGATEAEAGIRQTLLVFAAPVFLVLGLVLQFLVTAHSSRVD